MPILVMKFGGTSVATLDRIRRAAKRVGREVANGFDVIVIVSAMSGETNNPFILVLAQFFPETDPFKDAPNAVLAPFAHLGIEMSEQAHVDQIAERAQEAGCLAMPPTMMPPPIGYICMLRDPDGNMVEFSWDQGVWSTLRERWDSAAD